MMSKTLNVGGGIKNAGCWKALSPRDQQLKTFMCWLLYIKFMVATNQKSK